MMVETRLLTPIREVVSPFFENGIRVPHPRLPSVKFFKKNIALVLALFSDRSLQGGHTSKQANNLFLLESSVRERELS